MACDAGNSNVSSFTFIDLFAGIGGFHMALHSLGGTCVFASEWNNAARKTYHMNFARKSPALFENNLFRGDITLQENQDAVPHDADILCAGFPCQPFSQAGVQKGFNEARGTLFFEIAKIIKEKKPKALFLENVRNLLKHDNGRTFAVIRSVLEVELGYTVHYKIMKASDYGLPTNRPRLFIVAFRQDIKHKESFSFPDPIPLRFTMSDVFQGACSKKIGFTLRVGGRASGIADKRNWDAYEVDGHVRYLTPQEGKLMMGFPEDFHFPVSAGQAMKQLGNSVAVDPVRMTAQKIQEILHKGA